MGERLFGGLMRGVMYFGSALLSLIMLFIVTDVCMRYFFNNPIQGSYEIVEVLMGMLSPVVILYCAWHRGHVAVDIFFEKFPPAIQRVCAIFSSLCCVGLCLLLTWRALFLVRELYVDDAVTNLLFIPWWPVGVVVCICFILMSYIEIQCLVQTCAAPCVAPDADGDRRADV